MACDLLGSGQIESVHVGRLHKVPVGALTGFRWGQPEGGLDRRVIE
jgi:hypothetical protein